MTTKIFSIANQKGGVGKTTTAVNLACGLAKQGVPTLLIDLDSQGNASSALGIERSENCSLYNVFLGNDKISEKIVDSGRKHLDMIPSEPDLATLESLLLQQGGNYLARLREILTSIKRSGKYGAIIIDCPPALGLLTMNSLAAADYVLVTLQCEYLALEGLSQCLGLIEEIRDSKANADLKLGGILMTMYDVRTSLSKAIVDEVAKAFPKEILKTRIPRTVRLGEAPSHGKSIFEYDERCMGAYAYAALTKEVIKRFSLK